MARCRPRGCCAPTRATFPKGREKKNLKTKLLKQPEQKLEFPTVARVGGEGGRTGGRTEWADESAAKKRGRGESYIDGAKL